MVLWQEPAVAYCSELSSRNKKLLRSRGTEEDGGEKVRQGEEGKRNATCPERDLPLASRCGLCSTRTPGPLEHEGPKLCTYALTTCTEAEGRMPGPSMEVWSAILRWMGHSLVCSLVLRQVPRITDPGQNKNLSRIKGTKTGSTWLLPALGHVAAMSEHTV